MKPRHLITLAACFFLAGCQGLTIAVTPDGKISAAYMPPAVVSDKGSK